MTQNCVYSTFQYTEEKKQNKNLHLKKWNHFKFNYNPVFKSLSDKIFLNQRIHVGKSPDSDAQTLTQASSYKACLTGLFVSMRVWSTNKQCAST